MQVPSSARSDLHSAPLVRIRHCRPSPGAAAGGGLERLRHRLHERGQRIEQLATGRRTSRLAGARVGRHRTGGLPREAGGKGCWWFALARERPPRPGPGPALHEVERGDRQGPRSATALVESGEATVANFCVGQLAAWGTVPTPTGPAPPATLVRSMARKRSSMRPGRAPPGWRTVRS